MTTEDILNYCKAVMNEENAISPNWSDDELLRIVEKKCNEALSFIGLVDAKTTTLSVANQGDYDYPTNFVRIRRVWYAGIPCKYLHFRQYESRQPGGISPTGTPREFTLYNNIITFTPIPSVGGDTITIFGEKQQTSMTSTSVQVDLPSLFHGAICDGVIAEMFAKDLNSGFYDRFNNKWNETHIPAMREFAKRRRRRGLPTTVVDADALLETEFGVI